MQIGIFAKTFPGTDAMTVLSAVHAAGYDTAQFNMACLGLPAMPDAITPEQTAAVAAAATATGVSIAAVSGTYNMIHPDPTVRATGLARLETLAASAHAMGTRLITLCTGSRDADDQWRHHPDNASPAAWSDLVTEMEKAVILADRYDVELGVEPELANVVSSASAARRLIDEIGSPRIRIILDPANLFETEADHARIIAAAVDLLGPHIAMAHAKDRKPDGSFTAAGTGVVDFAAFMTDLKAAGFNGPMITHGLDASEAASVSRYLRQSLEAAS